jgi:hypothetical protein
MVSLNSKSASVRPIRQRVWIHEKGNSKGELNASGIEAVGAVPGEDVASLKVLPGAYSILVHLIGWDREPGAKDGRGRPTSNALPDFVVLANPTVSGNDPFRTELRTFKK